VDPDDPLPLGDRRIAHLDMDAFYASVELLRRPQLRGRPVAIGGRGDPTRRGVVTTATYEARAFGIHSGMALSVAARRCPECVFLPVDFERYREVSRRFKQAIAAVTTAIEDRGIDEVYLDLTGLPERAEVLARTLARRVHEATGLTCSVGVAPNKLLAKIASDLDKPNGITVLGAGDIPARIWPLAARKVPGIGPKADATLQAMGIGTIGELAAADPDRLTARFGERYGGWLHRAAHGRDERALDLDPEPRSRSRETTFQRDQHPVRDWTQIARTLVELSTRVAEDLTARGYRGRTVGIKVRFSDFRTVTRDRTVSVALDDAGSIRSIAFECLRRVALQRPIRLLGVRVGELSPVTRSDAPTEPDAPAAPNATLPLFRPPGPDATPQPRAADGGSTASVGTVRPVGTPGSPRSQ
jgi:DNA polymerase-4